MVQKKTKRSHSPKTPRPRSRAAPRRQTARNSRSAKREPLKRKPLGRTRVNGQLATLESAHLIRTAQLQPELEYVFRHALVQEAAYESLLRNNRRMLHLTIGEVLEQLYPDRLDEFAPVLGNHFDEVHRLAGR